jgi:hypothetical protein
MVTKLTRLTHKIAIQLHLVAESCTFTVLAPSGQSGNFWIHHKRYCLQNHIRQHEICHSPRRPGSKMSYPLPR